jgi:hypothetical protein
MTSSIPEKDRFMKDYDWLNNLGAILPKSVFGVYKHIRQRCGFDGKGSCFELQSSIATSLDITERSVRNAFSVLTQIKAIQINQEKTKNQTSLLIQGSELFDLALNWKQNFDLRQGNRGVRNSSTKERNDRSPAINANKPSINNVHGREEELSVDPIPTNSFPLFVQASKVVVAREEFCWSNRIKISYSIGSKFPIQQDQNFLFGRFFSVKERPLKRDQLKRTNPNSYELEFVVNASVYEIRTKVGPRTHHWFDLDHFEKLDQKNDQNQFLFNGRDFPPDFLPTPATMLSLASAITYPDAAASPVSESEPSDFEAEEWLNSFAKRLFEYAPRNTPRKAIPIRSWLSLSKLAAGDDLRIGPEEYDVSAILSPKGIGDLAVVSIDTSSPDSTRLALRKAASVPGASPLLLVRGDVDVVHDAIWEMIKGDPEFNTLRYYVIDISSGYSHYLRFAHDGVLGKPQNCIRDSESISLHGDEKLVNANLHLNKESLVAVEESKIQEKGLMNSEPIDNCKPKTLVALKRQSRLREATERATLALQPAALASEPDPRAKEILRTQAAARESRALAARDKRLQQKCVDAVALVDQHETPASLALEFGKEYTPALLHAWWSKLAKALSIPVFTFEPRYSKQWEQFLKRCNLNKVDALDFIHWSMTSWKKIQEHNFSYREIDPVPSFLVSAPFFERVSKLYSERLVSSPSSPKTEGKSNMKEKWSNF